jgi:dihydropteroate synthase
MKEGQATASPAFSGVAYARGKAFPWSRWSPILMGVVNASPESFSDGGLYPTLDSQIRASLQLVEDGAQIIDVGGESGVTGIAPLQPSQERDRVVPLVRALVAEGLTVSVDTWKKDVASAAIDAGASIINDVSGLLDPRLASICGESDAGLVIMHTRARPKHKDFPHMTVQDAVDDIRPFLADRINLAVSMGVPRKNIIIDPGPDFGKTPAQTVAALRRLSQLRELNCAILLAVSRKDFIGAITSTAPIDRLPGTLAAIAAGLGQGAGLLRVHDVAATRDFLSIASALDGVVEVSELLRLDIRYRRQHRRP